MNRSDRVGAGRRRLRRTLCSACYFVGTALALPAHAFDWGWQATTGYTHSDNVAQTPVGDSVDILSSSVSAALAHSTRTLELDGEATYLYRYFTDRDYSSTGLPQVRGDVEWAAIPERLLLSASDVYGQVAFNPAEGLLPSAYENSNVLTVGPQLFLPLSLETRFVATGSYRDARFETSDVTSKRRYGELRFEHSLTSLIEVFASAGRSKTEFEIANTSTEFDIDSLLAGFDLVSRRSALSVTAGFEKLDNGDDTFDGVRYNASFERQLSRWSTVFASALRETADAADVFSLAQISDPGLAGVRDVQVTAQPLVRQAYLLGYGRTGHRLGASIAAGYRKERFRPLEDAEEVPSGLGSNGLDRNIRELLLNANYVWSSRTALVGRAQLLFQDFDMGMETEDTLVSLAWIRGLAARLELEVEAQRIERSNSPRNFDEWRFMLTLRYTGRELPGRSQAMFDRDFERRVRRIRQDRETPAPNQSLPGEAP